MVRKNKKKELQARKKYYKKNKKEILLKKKEYYEKNKEKINKRARITTKKWYHKNKKRARLYSNRYYRENKEKKLEYHKKWYKKNKEKRLQQCKEYYQKNRKRVQLIHRNYNRRNKEKLSQYKKRWQEYTRKTNPQYRLDENMGTAIWASLKNKKAGHKWEALVEYDLENLIAHLERCFNRKMNWGNYGSYWEIDHIKPKSLFNYISSDNLEFKKCWALKNLQPLEKIKNIKKGNRYVG